MARSDQSHRGRWVIGKNFNSSALRADVQLTLILPTKQRVSVTHAEAVALVETHQAEVLSGWAVEKLTDGKRFRK